MCGTKYTNFIYFWVLTVRLALGLGSREEPEILILGFLLCPKAILIKYIRVGLAMLRIRIARLA